MSAVYLIGSLRNSRIPYVANELERLVPGLEVYADWFAPGPEADDRWLEYERARGRGVVEAIRGHHARAVFEDDRSHLDRCDGVVLVLPAGRSAHLELGYTVGRGRPAWVLLDPEPPEDARLDVMYRFATGVHEDLASIAEEVRRCLGPSTT